MSRLGKRLVRDSFAFDIYGFYMTEVRRYDVLSRKEEFDLFLSYTQEENQIEKQRLREKFLNHNQGLVISIAKTYRARSLDMQELIQWGNIGLIRAFEKFKPETGNKFSTMATPWIHAEIGYAIICHGHTVRIADHVQKKIRKVNRVKREVFLKDGRLPTTDEIVQKTGLNRKQVEELYFVNNIGNLDSVDRVIQNENGTSKMTIGDLIADSKSMSASFYVDVDSELKIVAKEFDQLVKRVQRKFSDEFCQIYNFLYGLDDESFEWKKYEDASIKLGLPYETVKYADCTINRFLRKKKNEVQMLFQKYSILLELSRESEEAA